MSAALGSVRKPTRGKGASQRRRRDTAIRIEQQHPGSATATQLTTYAKIAPRTRRRSARLITEQRERDPSAIEPVTTMTL
jgi:hypothetical protein